jgi:hypothetical protein
MCSPAREGIITNGRGYSGKVIWSDTGHGTLNLVGTMVGTLNLVGAGRVIIFKNSSSVEVNINRYEILINMR